MVDEMEVSGSFIARAERRAVATWQAFIYPAWPGMPCFRSAFLVFVASMSLALDVPAVQMEPFSCAELASPHTPVSNAVLGCTTEGVADGFPEFDWELVFPKITADERLLARVTFLVPGERYPSRTELLEYFESKASSGYSIADLLALDALWIQSDFWAKVLLEEIADKPLDPHPYFIREVLILSVLSWFEDGRQNQMQLNQLRNRAFHAEEALRDSSLPWGKAHLAYAYYAGGVIARDLASSKKLVKTDARWSPRSQHLSLVMLSNDEILNLPDSELHRFLSWANLGLLEPRVGLWAERESFDAKAKSLGIPSTASLLRDASSYGLPGANYQAALAHESGHQPFRENRERFRKLMWAAADWGYEYAADEVIKWAILERDYKTAFELAVYNAAIGYVEFADNGYGLASALAELAHTQTDAEKWQDVLAASCHSALALHSDPKYCPRPRTSTMYERVLTRHLVSLNADDIRAPGSFSLDTGRFKALLIGNQNYENWSKLKTPLDDIEQIGEVLEKQYGFQVTYVRDGSRREILQEIYRLGLQTTFEDHVLVYYAGHGVIDRFSQEAYWVPTNAPRDFPPDWVSADEIKTAFRSIPARHLALIADSCYSGKLLRGDEVTVSDPTESVIKRLFSKKARVAITSGGEEPVSDSANAGKHSVFAEALLAALRDNHAPLPASTLYELVLSGVTLEANQTPQYAGMRELDHDGGDFIFVPANWR